MTPGWPEAVGTVAWGPVSVHKSVREVGGGSIRGGHQVHQAACVVFGGPASQPRT